MILFSIFTTRRLGKCAVAWCCLATLHINRRPCYAFSLKCRADTIQPGFWTFHYKGKDYPIAYEKLEVVCNDSASRRTPVFHSSPVLMLNGFGMGSFHQHRLMNELRFLLTETGMGQDIRVSTLVALYGMDYLGQGKSWPIDCDDGDSDSEHGLRYCGQTWVDQIIHFIEETITAETDTARVHLVGNSVGGYLAVCVAAARPDLIESVCLLNATPIWGMNLPGWSGHLPAPPIPKLVGRFLFDHMRDFPTIESFLKTTYANPTAYDTKLVEQIRSCTDGPGGHAAFASILWSPPVTVTLASGIQAGFYDCLQAMQCDVLLCYGSDDPWCKPAFARRILRRLAKRDCLDGDRLLAHRYLELSNVGHCANHEAPKATAAVLTQWLLSADKDRRRRPLLSEKKMPVREAWGETVVEERTLDEIPLSFVDRLAVSVI